MNVEFPNLCACYIAMVADQGVSAGSVDATNFLITCDQLIDDKLVTRPQLRKAELALTKLTEAERETLAVGDQADWPPIFQKIGRGQANLHCVLDVLFENMMGFHT